MTHTPSRRIVAEFVGTGFLVAAVVGSGIMGERLAGGNVVIALLANTIATGAALAALIFTFGPNFWSAFESCRDARRTPSSTACRGPWPRATCPHSAPGRSAEQSLRT